MSADRQRLTSAIRRIAKTDPEIRGLLDAADNKGGKPGAAGVGSSTDAESQRICCDGSVSDNANPGTETRDPTDGDQDGLDPDDPANLGGLGGGSLTGITDCDTGEPICFEGDGFIPPDGWDAPDDPGEEWDVDKSIYWTGNAPQGTEVFRTLGAAKQYMASDPQFCYWENDRQGAFRLVVGSCDGNVNLLPAARWDCDEPGGYDNQANDTYCYTDYNEDPLPQWPSDGCVNLSVKGGTIVGSKYDPENDGSYSAPRSELHLCDGTDDIYLKPSADGGWKSIDSTKTSGYLYGSDFKLIAHIDGNEYSDPSI